MPGQALPRLLVAGLSGGSGKTLVALGLVRALTLQGLAVTACKKGPDYIDAAWLALAAGKRRESTPAKPGSAAALWGDAQAPVNLDPFFLDEDRLRAQLIMRHGAGDVAIIEGNRGLFDGRDVAGSCSSAALARALDCPVVVVINATKMTRTAAALVAGLHAFEPFRFAGVIFNQVGTARHGRLLREAVEQHTNVPVLGLLPRLPQNPLPERHMGLAGGHRRDATVEACLDALAAQVTTHCDLPALRAAAYSAPPLAAKQPFWPTAADASAGPRPRIGVVRDEALWFYYPENLDALERAGAEIIPLRLLEAQAADDAVWNSLHGLYLGGGFPETVAGVLSRSPNLLRIRELVAKGLPVYAECGGLMILCHSLCAHGVETPMAGVLPLRAVQHARPQGLGYVEATVRADNPFLPVGTPVRGHEFHYSACEKLDGNLPFEPETEGAPEPVFTLTAGTGLGRHHGKRADGWQTRQVLAAYTHLFAPAVPDWAKGFVRAAKPFV